ncbi:PREDICTED: uncharacterized protein LOC107351546 isoform X2 [Acropora digitifera]|uniref:uncharacterized protein LOC107351546 isoform X2 n=1 Tax=Acropora digitifera TaxID=70779 RepID=UPI000779FE70|nr:PREDICTED: uncharacterized protein LOC107351546 isoform X2 [Acropora digitifera]
MKVDDGSSTALAKKPWPAGEKFTTELGNGAWPMDIDSVVDDQMERSSALPKPWPPAERKNGPTEHGDDTCNEKVDHDGDVIMDGDDIAAKVQRKKLCISHLDALKQQQRRQQQQELQLPLLKQPASQPQSSVRCIERGQKHVIQFLHPDISQSTFPKKKKSFACTFIALWMAMLFCVYNNVSVNEALSDLVLLEIICRAILVGNSVHDHVTHGKPTLFSVHEAIWHMTYPNDVIGKTCVWRTWLTRFTNENSQEPLSSLSFFLRLLPHLSSNIAALVITNHMTMCFVARGGKLFLLDSHFHPDYGGAMIGVSDISGTESFLADVKERLRLRDNRCSVTYVRFN